MSVDVLGSEYLIVALSPFVPPIPVVVVITKLAMDLLEMEVRLLAQCHVLMEKKWRPQSENSRAGGKTRLSPSPLGENLRAMVF